MPRRFRNFLNSRCNTRIELEHGVLPEARPVKPTTRPVIPRIPVHPRSTSRYIPRLNGALKLLFDPRRELGLNPHDVYFPLGSNVVKNGDFSDFTMDDDASTVVHWIFDDIFDVENGGVGYVGQDWKTQTETVLINDVNDSNVVPSPDIKKTYIEPGVAEFEVVNANNPYVSLNGTAQVGKFHILRFKIRAMNADAETKAPTIGTFNTIAYGYTKRQYNSPDWQVFEAVFYQSDSTAGQYFYPLPNTLGARVQIKDFEFFAVDGAHLISQGAGGGIETWYRSGSPRYSGGNVIAFDGVNDYFKIPASKGTAFDPGTGDFTIEFYAKVPNDSASYYRLQAKRSGTAGYEIILNSLIFGAFIGDGTNWVQPVPSHGLTPGTWHHFAVIVDRTNAQMHYKVDGVLLQTNDISTVTGSLSNSGDFYIGANFNLSLFYPSEIAEIRYSNVARTDTEIWDSYGLARYWRFMDTPQPHNYNNSFIQRLNSPDTSAGANPSAYQTVNTRQNTLYLLRGFEKRIAGTANTHIFVYNATDGNMGTWPNDQTDIPNGVVLQKFFRPTVVTTDVYIRQHYTGDAIFDNIEIRPILSAGMQDFGFAKNFANGKIVYRSITLNDGFENGTLDYHYGNGTWVYGISNTVSFHGNYSAEITTDGTVGERRVIRRAHLSLSDFSQWIPGWYRVRAAVRVPTGWDGGNFMFSNDATLTTKTEYNPQFTPIENQWVMVYGYFHLETPDDAGVIWLRCTADPSANQTIYVDDFVVELIEGGGNHGYVYGSLYDGQPKHPAAFEFDGVDDRVQWNDIVIGTNDFLLFAWVKGQPASGQGIIVGRRNDTNNYAPWFWVIGSGGQQRFGFSNDGANATNFYSNTVINDDKWHLVMVHGDMRNGVVTFFIDGRTDGDGTGLVAFTRESGLVLLGASEWAGSVVSPFDGLIGVSGMFIGDFSQLDVEKLVQYIYDQTKIFYEV